MKQIISVEIKKNVLLFYKLFPVILRFENKTHAHTQL